MSFASFPLTLAEICVRPRSALLYYSSRERSTDWSIDTRLALIVIVVAEVLLLSFRGSDIASGWLPPWETAAGCKSSFPSRHVSARSAYFGPLHKLSRVVKSCRNVSGRGLLCMPHA